MLVHVLTIFIYMYIYVVYALLSVHLHFRYHVTPIHLIADNLLVL